MENERGALAPTEPHPSAWSAAKYVNRLGYEKLMSYREAFASCAIENNRLGEICAETINRILEKRTVSDRYLLGLVWAIRDMEDEHE